MRRLQTAILIVLGFAILGMMAAVAYLLLRPEAGLPSAATLPAATVPPNPLLLTRAPLCQEVVQATLGERGLSGAVTLDAQDGRLEVSLDPMPAASEETLPIGEIWGAFEAVLQGRDRGCDGFTRVVLLVGEYRAEVAAPDLAAWGAAEIDDAAFSSRVRLTK